MIKKFKIKIKNKSEIFALTLLLLITIISTTYYNYTKNKIAKNYKEIINNIYFKKTVNHFLDNLEPKYKKINHQVKIGETFDNILEQYSIDQEEILDIKEQLSREININKLNINQKISFTIDQSNNSIKEFIFKISNKEKILLSKDTEKNNFDQKTILTKLNKKTTYGENIILQSLYKSASIKKIPATNKNSIRTSLINNLTNVTPILCCLLYLSCIIKKYI